MGVTKILSDQFHSRKLIWSLAKNDFKTRYVGSYFGLVWEILQPLSLIFIFWFLFGFIFHNSTPEGIPFLPWLIVGLIPWFFFSDAWMNATNSFIQYSYLVKKMVFQTSVIPTVKILSSLFTSLIFHAILLVVLLMTPGISFHFSGLAVIYFFFCTIVLVTGLSFLTSSVLVFFKDTRQILNIVLQMGVYLTPILWNKNLITGKDMHWVVQLNQLNPMSYVVDGYRSALLQGGYSLDLTSTLIFWVITLVILTIGIAAYSRLRPHFADVL
jgi:teichoic acid transport system permease protein